MLVILLVQLGLISGPGRGLGKQQLPLDFSTLIILKVPVIGSNPTLSKGNSPDGEMSVE